MLCKKLLFVQGLEDIEMGKESVFAERFEAAIKAGNMTLTELSKKTGISVSLISRYRSGEVIPRRDKLLLISSALSVSPAYLTGDSNGSEEKPSVIEDRGIFAERFSKAVKDSGLLPVEIAEKTNISETMISRYKSGEYVPRRRNLEKLASVLLVSPAYLTGDSDEKVDPDTVPLTVEAAPSEIELLEEYRKLSYSNKTLVKEIISLLKNRQR
jgi:transcriptional regulator with XRE-family HTH domain